jgi:hypothetical protein
MMAALLALALLIAGTLVLLALSIAGASGASSYTFAEATWKRDLAAWIVPTERSKPPVTRASMLGTTSYGTRSAPLPTGLRPPGSLS